jgi:hypothetical protein
MRKWGNRMSKWENRLNLLALIFVVATFALYGFHFVLRNETSLLRVGWVIALGLAVAAEVASRLVGRSQRAQRTP